MAMSKSKEDHYIIKVYCDNCDWVGTQAIPKGHAVGSLTINGVECPCCGCETLRSLGQPNNPEINY